MDAFSRRYDGKITTCAKIFGARLLCKDFLRHCLHCWLFCSAHIISGYPASSTYLNRCASWLDDSVLTKDYKHQCCSAFLPSFGVLVYHTQRRSTQVSTIQNIHAPILILKTCRVPLGIKSNFSNQINISPLRSWAYPTLTGKRKTFLFDETTQN